MTVRVRFAPSPTGTLHLGSARSALYNWLYARHFGDAGTYVLRIEDTDRERSTPEHVDQALRVFRWLGLEWDEGPEVGGPHVPYFQSQRDHLYAEALQQLRDSGRAYDCFCSRELLDADRSAAQADGRPLIYQGRCRSLTADERASRHAAGEAFTIRFRSPDGGTTTFDDAILGATSFENALIGDFVIARADGSPLYNFANVVDDALMRITHVIRGNDHVSNTPRQVLLYEALGHEVPVFAHVPMILGEDGAKLSKRRHHTATIEQLAEEGYLPAAVRNGIALLGWGLDAETTVMSTRQMIGGFDIARVNRSPAKVDYQKLRHINGQHLRSLEAADFAAAYEEWRAHWLPGGEPGDHAAHVVTGEQAALLCREKVDTLGEVPGLVAFLVEPFEMTEPAWQKLESAPDAGLVLDHVRAGLEELADWSVESIEGVLRGACDELDRKPRVVFGPVRFAVTGRTVTPGLFESMHVLGRDRSLTRIDEARARLAGVSA